MSDVINERQVTHGDWHNTSRISQGLKAVMDANGKDDIRPEQREALDMIAVKIARILSGDPDAEDHWEDIKGYAELGKQHDLKKKNTAGRPKPGSMEYVG